MTTDQWFSMLLFLGVYISCLILLDGAHKTRIGELKSIHREQVSGLRSYIRTLNRERKWLEAELAKVQRERERADGNPLGADAAFDPFANGNNADPAHINWLPPSEEYGERD